MSNNVDNKAPEKLSPEEMIERTRDNLIDLPVKGTVFLTTSNALVDSLFSLVKNTAISQLDKLLLNIDYQNGVFREIRLVASMDLSKKDTSGGKAMVYVNGVDNGFGKDSNGGRMKITSMIPMAGRSNFQGGRYSFNDEFKNKVASIAQLDDRGNIRIYDAPGVRNPYIALMDLNFQEVMSWAFSIRGEDCFNWSLISAEPLGGDNYSLTFIKYIQNGGSGKNRGNRNIDYNSIKRGLGFGGGNRQNGNRNRGF